MTSMAEYKAIRATASILSDAESIAHRLRNCADQIQSRVDEVKRWRDYEGSPQMPKSEAEREAKRKAIRLAEEIHSDVQTMLGNLRLYYLTRSVADMAEAWSEQP